MRYLILIFSALFLFGCATPPAQITQNANYGPYPENYKEIVIQFFETRLKDPFSAKYKYNGLPQKAYARKPPVIGGGVAYYGYITYVSVNAKNGFGGYTGWENYRLLIREGGVIENLQPNPYFSEPWYKK